MVDTIPLEFKDWRVRSIIWLDYDHILNQTAIDDIEILCRQVSSGSIVLITVNAVPKKYREKSTNDDTVEGLELSVGISRVPSQLIMEDLEGWGMAKHCRNIIHNELEEKINFRLDSRTESFNYRQLFNFIYEDGAKMLTVGGIVFKNDERSNYERCAFENDFYFCRTGEDAYNIRVPRLTFKEIRTLNEHMPLASKGFPFTYLHQSDMEDYANIYRYFPTFSEVDV